MPKKRIGRMEFSVKDSIFGVNVHVLLNCDEEDLKKWYKKQGVEEYSSQKLDPNFCGFSTFLTCRNAPDKYLIFINNYDWSIDSQETLIHEIIHTIFKIWDKSHSPVCMDTQEFFATTVGRMWSSIASEIWKRRKR